MKALLPLVALIALAFAPAAQARGGFGVTPAVQSFQVGTGGHPDVAVDSSGVAHVVWDEKDQRCDRS